jgi:hypothetical protein
MAGPRRRRRVPRPGHLRVEIRLTEAELRSIRAASSRPGRGVSVARFIAEAALVAAGAPPPVQRRAPSTLVLAEIVDAVTAVNRVGNNLNQLARSKNTTGVRPPGTYAEIQRALSALDRLAQVTEAADPRP